MRATGQGAFRGRKPRDDTFRFTKPWRLGGRVCDASDTRRQSVTSAVLPPSRECGGDSKCLDEDKAASSSGENQTEDSGPNGRNLRSTVDPVGSICLILSTSALIAGRNQCGEPYLSFY